MTKQTRRRFSVEFKADAVTLGGAMGVMLGRPLVVRLSSRAVSALVYTQIGVSLLNMTYDLLLV